MAIADTDIFTVEADYHDGTSVQTLRVSDAGPVPLTTGVSDTPPSTQFMSGLGGFVMQSRNAFGNCQTSGSADVADGEVTLLNPNGFNAPFDQFRGRAFDGRIVTVRRGQRAGAYPASYRTLMRAPMHAPVWGHDEFTLRVRDARKLTSVPLTTTLYAGTNVAGVGLEGTPDDLKGKRKPVAMGRTFNVNPVLVNAQQQTYQFHDGTGCTVSDVRDGGFSLGVSFPLTSRTVPATNDNWYRIAYGNGKYVAVSASNALSLVSTDGGVTWASHATPATYLTIVYADALGLFVACGGGTIGTSPDGVTWTARTSFTAQTIGAVSWSPKIGLLCAVTSSVGVAAASGTSPDGITWTLHASISANKWTTTAMTWGKDRFVVVGQDVTTGGVPALIAYSLDGITFTQATDKIAPGNTLQGVAYDSINDRYVACWAGSTDLESSEDALTWTRRPTGGSIGWRSVCANDGMFVAVGDQNAVNTSNDGIVWTQRTAAAGTIAGLNDVVLVGTNVVTVGYTGALGEAFSSAPIGSYATLADLQSDSPTLTPAQGTYKIYSGTEGSFFRLGSPAVGTITCDVVQGANAAARTGAQIMVQGFTRAGLVVGTNWSAADITALDAANSAEMGVWYGPDDTAMCADPIDAAARSLGAFWAGDSSGVIRTKRLTDPSLGSSIATFTENDLQQTLIPLDSGEQNEGIAPYQTKVLYGKNYTVQTSGLDGAVSGAERAQFALEWREAKATDAAVLAAHPLSQPSVIETIYAFEADAQTEATRLQTLKGANREWFSVPLKLTDAALDLELGDIITIVNGRFGLGLGVKAVVLGIAPDFKDSPAATHTLTVWTLAADASFAMYFMADGSDVIIGSGAEAYAFTDSGGGDYTLTAAPFAPTTARLNMALKAGDITLS